MCILPFEFQVFLSPFSFAKPCAAFGLENLPVVFIIYPIRCKIENVVLFRARFPALEEINFQRYLVIVSFNFCASYSSVLIMQNCLFWFLVSRHPAEKCFNSSFSFIALNSTSKPRCRGCTTGFFCPGNGTEKRCGEASPTEFSFGSAAKCSACPEGWVS